MRFSSFFCREQEALQRKTALVETLMNRREIALNAAKTWAAAALVAEKRENQNNQPNRLDAEITALFAAKALPENTPAKTFVISDM